MAHEFGHHVHKDVMLGIIVRLVLTLSGFWLANIVMNLGIAFFGYRGLTDPATLPLLIIALSIFGLVTCRWATSGLAGERSRPMSTL